LACWDWWGYVSGDDSYVTKSGRQIQVIKAMLDALAAGYRSAIPAETPGNAPRALAIIDTSDTAAALAWMPVRGATLYRISRADTDGNFVTVGSTAASSFADTGLSPQTFYRWHVTAIINGSETSAPAEASATTRASPPPCEQPGNCPIGALTR
jgi:poly(3-hydroxybutyrate) depolymerase